ncbi:hypothetical protein AB0H45_17600 [Streptomyces atroolivaceus]|uniref:hypothetical protein n=1 Tax=Streptomyces atroolivaceus TaxID=66869 RepID=UPI0033E0CF27
MRGTRGTFFFSELLADPFARRREALEALSTSHQFRTAVDAVPVDHRPRGGGGAAVRVD